MQSFYVSVDVSRAFIQILQSSGNLWNLMFTFPGPQSPGMRPRSWKVMENEWLWQQILTSSVCDVNT